MKVVFLDIDGVLNCEGSRSRCVGYRGIDDKKVENLAKILKRNDIKKSEAYQSGFLEGTTPMYESYMRLKKNIADSI